MRGPNLRPQSLIGAFVAVLALAGAFALLAGPVPAARAQVGGPGGGESELVNLDFNDVELNVVIDTISRMTGYNFIYDDRVRGRVTIVSPTEVTVDQAFAVFDQFATAETIEIAAMRGGASVRLSASAAELLEQR